MRRLAAALLVAAVSAALTGCGGGDWAQRCTTKDAVTVCAPDQRPAPRAVSGTLLDGGPYDLGKDRGKVVVVNFWGSWCSPCRAEAVDLEKTYQATKAQNVAFLGVNWRDDRDAARAFERGRVTYPSIFDADGKVAVQFEVTQTATPSTLILDRQGRVAVLLRKPTNVAELQPLVERIAAESAN